MPNLMYKPFCFALTREGFSSKRMGLKVGVLQVTGHRSQACVSTFQPGNFTGWGSEGVKSSTSTTRILIIITNDSEVNVVLSVRQHVRHNIQGS